MKKELSVIVSSYKNHSLLKLCLESLKKNLGEIDYEIIVVDGETQEATFDMMREFFPEIFLISNEKNVGFSSLVNQGIERAKGDYFFIINSDIIVKKGSVEKLLDFVKKNENVGLAGPKLINFDQSIQQSVFRFYKLITIIYRRTFLKNFGFAKRHLNLFLMNDEKRYDTFFDVDWVMGSAMMTSKRVVEEVGKMDDGFFMYFEDVDWCWRFWEKKMRVVFFPEAEVFHYHGKQSSNKNVFSALLFNRYARVHIQSALRFFLKNIGKKNPHELYEKEVALKNKG